MEVQFPSCRQKSIDPSFGTCKSQSELGLCNLINLLLDIANEIRDLLLITYKTSLIFSNHLHYAIYNLPLNNKVHAVLRVMEHCAHDANLSLLRPYSKTLQHS